MIAFLKLGRLSYWRQSPDRGRARAEPSYAPAIFAASPRPVKVSGLILLALAIALAATCNSGRGPGVYAPGQETPLPLQLVSVKGVRDGNRMRATVLYRGAEQDRLQLELELEVGVPTRLSRGRYLRRSPTTDESGMVKARSITFLGGQSDWPNLGASLELFQGPQLRYLVRLSPTPVDPRGADLGSPR